MTELYSENFKRLRKYKLSYNDEKFCKWIDLVEKIVFNETNFHLLDLKDDLYMINFQRRITPKRMARIVIKNFYEYFL